MACDPLSCDRNGRRCHTLAGTGGHWFRIQRRIGYSQSLR
jgi:hypothetical protein